MGKRSGLAKVLALVGIVLLALPILAPAVFGVLAIGQGRGFRFDYLMPFEAYPIALLGTILVLVASLAAHHRRGAVGICIGMMIGGVLLAAVAAQVTGIANSVETLETWRYAVVIGFAVVSIIGQIALIAVAVRLLRDLSAAKPEVAAPADAMP
ncbi:MAG: hypothetical protein EG823_04190 [Actinobacteria bacterium]|nr:hypothetical protein [Actinomycetota bacterium]